MKKINDQNLVKEERVSEVDISSVEAEEFDAFIKEYRQKYIRKASVIVEEIFNEIDFTDQLVVKKEVSEVILKVREIAYQRFLIEEALLNTLIISHLHQKLETPKQVMVSLIRDQLEGKEGVNLKEIVPKICGEYAGKIYPYIYTLSLSNTNSRRSRSGKTFEAIIYKIYEILNYPFDSQGKLGRKIFEDVGLGKKVDSVLPGIEQFNQRRNKAIIGTMKTSLRERWQEVAEEIERTNIPEIHLLTVDTDIAKSKAQEMAAHNIVLVGLKSLIENGELKDMKNIISFEDYFYNEIPRCLQFWNEEKKI